VVEAFDCGAVVNPVHLKNQIEGAITMAIGGAATWVFSDPGGNYHPVCSYPGQHEICFAYSCPLFGGLLPCEAGCRLLHLDLLFAGRQAGTSKARRGNPMDFSESVIAEEIDEILRRTSVRMQQQRLHIEEMQVGPEASNAQVRLSQTHAMWDRLRIYRARLT
jgi:hypothetical protein